MCRQKGLFGIVHFLTASFFVESGIFLARKQGMFYTLLQKEFNRNILGENSYEFISNTSYRNHCIGL